MSHETKITKSQHGERVSFFRGNEVENSVIGSDVVIGNDAIVIDSEIEILYQSIEEITF